MNDEDIIFRMEWLKDNGFSNVQLNLTKFGWLLSCGCRWAFSTDKARSRTPEELGFSIHFDDSYVGKATSRNQNNVYWWSF